jgi:Fe-S-cluster containining protein
VLDTILPEGLRFGVLFDRLTSVHSMYIRAEEALASFRARNGLSCPPGCGACCEGFIPDILPLEASYLAAWLVRNRPERAQRIAEFGIPPSNLRGCPLYDPDKPDAHCTVYPGRPLICRLFAFSGVRSRTGTSSFSLCRRMPGLPPPRSGARSWEGPALEALFGTPPLMSDFGAELEGIVPGDGSRRLPLPEALPPAVRQVLFLAGLGKDDPGTDGNDPVLPPLPRAS